MKGGTRDGDDVTPAPCTCCPAPVSDLFKDHKIIAPMRRKLATSPLDPPEFLPRP